MVCTAICTALEDQLPPMMEEELVRVSDTFKKWNFPNCVGVIDGKHVAVKCPPSSVSLFYNHKVIHILISLHPIIKWTTCIRVFIGAYGSESDCNP